MNRLKKYIHGLITDQKRGVWAEGFKVVLFCFSFIYGAVVIVIVFFYEKRILPKVSLPNKVVSVGNLTWGGVGKTPFVAYLAKKLRSLKIATAILTRGYSSSGGAELDSDEALELSRDLTDIPVIVGRNRYLNAMQHLRTHDPEVFILDDGFQQWKLKRNLDIVLVDATNPWGNGHLLPRGILREPKSALSRSQIVVLTKTDQAKGSVEAIRQVVLNNNPDALIIESVHRPVGLVELNSNRAEPLSTLKGRSVAAICGIGDPGSFKRSLEMCSATVQKMFIHLDHHQYVLEDIKDVFAQCERSNIFCVVTTQKDAVKIAPLLDRLSNVNIPLYSLVIELQVIKGENELIQRVVHLS